MFGSDIVNVLSTDLKCAPVFRGVFASDMLPTYLNKGTTHALVVNLDAHDKPGSHWVGVFINASGSCIYFDPIGFPPFEHTIKDFISRNCTALQCNTMTIQNILSYTCGYYVIYFLRQMVRGVALKAFQSNFKVNNFHLNDSFICNVYNKKIK